jgi:hypothetical protein
MKLIRAQVFAQLEEDSPSQLQVVVDPDVQYGIAQASGLDIVEEPEPEKCCRSSNEEVDPAAGQLRSSKRRAKTLRPTACFSRSASTLGGVTDFLSHASAPSSKTRSIAPF